MSSSQQKTPLPFAGNSLLPIVLVVVYGGALAPTWAFGEPPKFEHHAIPADLPLSNNDVGDYGQTAIADLDKDGHPDFILGRKGSRDVSVLYWFRYVGPD
jgi:hypothetical protein